MILQQPIISFKHTVVLYGTDRGPPSTESLNEYHVQVAIRSSLGWWRSTFPYSEHGFTEEAQGRGVLRSPMLPPNLFLMREMTDFP